MAYIKCRIVRQYFGDQDILSKYIYGVEMLAEENGGFTTLCFVPDLSQDFHQIERFCELVNRSEVSQCHYWDILEDFCAQMY